MIELIFIKNPSSSFAASLACRLPLVLCLSSLILPQSLRKLFCIFLFCMFLLIRLLLILEFGAPNFLREISLI